MAVDNAKLETAVGNCGLGSCRSSCCEPPEMEDPQLKQIQIAMRVEMALLQKILLDKMIAGLKLDGQIPQINVLPTTEDPESPKRMINIRV